MLHHVDSRVAYLEGRMEDHTALMAETRSEMRELRSSMDRGFDRLDHKLDRHFMWLVGLQIGFATAIVGMLLRLT